MNDLLEPRGMTVELPTAAGWVRPVNKVSLHIAAGELLRLAGESGSGKTMLSLALMGLLPRGARVSGEILLRASDANKENNGAKADPRVQAAKQQNGSLQGLKPIESVGEMSELKLRPPKEEGEARKLVGIGVESGPADRVLREPSNVYTRELLAAVPEVPHTGRV